MQVTYAYHRIDTADWIDAVDTMVHLINGNYEIFAKDVAEIV